MAGRHRIIFCAALLAGACGNKKDVEHAKHSLYDTDFAIVYNTALSVTRGQYPTLNENPGPGKISTAWHQVSMASNQDDLSNPRTLAQQQGVQTGAGASAGMIGAPTRLAYKRYFIRFDVTVLGGRPWRVKVVGHASEWDPGAALPSELRGAERPSWLDGRTESLMVAIYKQLRKFAVPMKEEVEVTGEDDLPKTDPSTFTGVPAGAAKRLASLKDALAKRDYTALRPQLDENVVWSLGGGTGADVALATWQADPGTFEAMVDVINGGCAAKGDKEVRCPAGEPQAGKYQLVIEAKGDWKVTSFVRGE
ncbi:MAG TPA: hypothetical protein VFV99_06920 [Kofleriaceae bacterium]|nr:hypothetical protein [Kofleriaceae bacterium]